MAHIGRHTSDEWHDIVQRQGGDLGVELQEQREGLANATGSTYNADLHHIDDYLTLGLCSERLRKSMLAM